jgi:hypothetical protein
MGLLRRAAAAARVDEERPGRVSAQGLLRRSRRVRDDSARGASPRADVASAEPPLPPVLTVPPSPGEVGRTDQLAADLETSIGNLPDGVELPTRLFAVVSTTLHVSKGALLLFDQLRLVFAPWASLGYDQTTLHRLRIPAGANESFDALANGNPIVLSGSTSLAPYQAYFSAREFSSLGRLCMVPFAAADKLVGIVLLTDLRPPLPEENALLECLKVVAAAGSPRVEAARERRLAAAGPMAAQAPVSLEDQALRFISSRGGAESPALFLTLSLEEYALGVLAEHEHLDPFRLHEDIWHFLGVFVSDEGTASAVRQGIFVVGLRTVNPADLDLFIHQLTLYLDGLFGYGGSRKAGAPRILKMRSWPAEANDVRSLLDHLAS